MIEGTRTRELCDLGADTRGKEQMIPVHLHLKYDDAPAHRHLSPTPTFNHHQITGTNPQAGATGSAPLIRTDPAKLAQMHDLHVLGPLRLTQAFFPYLRQTAQKSGAKRGKIVNVGSVISNGMPWHAAYGSTKVGPRVRWVKHVGGNACTNDTGWCSSVE